jgi:hypothetical protein
VPLVRPFHAEAHGGKEHVLATVFHVVELGAATAELDAVGKRVEEAKLRDHLAAHRLWLVTHLRKRWAHGKPSPEQGEKRAENGDWAAGHVGHFGSRTESMTWMTPFEQPMSACTTFASFTMTPPASVEIFSSPPWTVFAELIPATSSEPTWPATTW